MDLVREVPPDTEWGDISHTDTSETKVNIRHGGKSGGGYRPSRKAFTEGGSTFYVAEPSQTEPEYVLVEPGTIYNLHS